MKIFAQEQLSPHKYKTPQGYLVCVDAVLARTGKQKYRKGDFFPNAQDAESEIDVDRPEKEVFSDEAMASFENMPVVIEHPHEDVTSDNWKQYSVGLVRDIHRGTFKGNAVMLGNLIIQDKQAIEDIMNDVYTELSCGYDCNVENEAAPFQSCIRGNHIALCSKGRAGIAKIQDSVPVKDTALTITVQCYILSEDGMQIVIQDRIGPAWKGLAVPGGHVKAGETPMNACIREVKEETGLTVSNLQLFGTHDYKCEEEGDCIALLYKTKTFSGTLHSSEEGRCRWMDYSFVCSAPNCAEGFPELLAKCVNNISVNDSKSYMDVPEKYAEAAKKARLTVEGPADAKGNVRIWGERYALESFKQKFDNDDAISYCRIKDSVKDKRWEVGQRVRYDGEWYYIINYSKSEWVLENDKREQVRVSDSFTCDTPANSEDIDTSNYVVGKNGVWFARLKGESSMLSKAFCSADKGKTWHTCYLETKSPAPDGRTQAGKYIFRTSTTFPGPRTSIGRNVLTWYAANHVHNVDDVLQIDHVNGNYTDDRLSNLERVSASENIRRMKAALRSHDSIEKVQKVMKIASLSRTNYNSIKKNKNE